MTALAGSDACWGERLISGLCMAAHPDVLCSYRRDGKAAGRMAAAIRAR